MNVPTIIAFCRRSIWLIGLCVVVLIAVAANAKMIQNVYQYTGPTITIFFFLAFVGGLWFAVRSFLKRRYFVPLLQSWGAKLASRPLTVTCGIAALSLLLRGLWLYLFQIGQFESDYEAYFERAVSYAGGVFPVDDYSALFPHVFGFSFVLGGVMKVFGSTMLVSQLFNIFLYLLSIVLLWFLFPARKQPGRYLFTLAVLSLWPSLIYFNTLANTEYLFIACFLLFLLVLKTTMNSRFALALPLSALLLLIAALSNFVRPIGSILVILFAIVLVLTPRNLIQKIAILAIGITVYLGLTTVMNAFVSDHIQLQAAKMPIGFNLFVGTNPDMQGEDLGLWNAADSQALGLAYQETGDAQAAHDQMLRLGLDRLSDWFGNGQAPFFLANKIKTAWGTDGWALQLVDSHMASYAKQESALRLYSKLHLPLMGLGDLLYMLFLTGAAIILFMRLKQNRFIAPGLVPFAACLFLIGTFFMLLLVESAPRYHLPGFVALLLVLAGTSGEDAKG